MVNKEINYIRHQISSNVLAENAFAPLTHCQSPRSLTTITSPSIYAPLGQRPGLIKTLSYVCPQPLLLNPNMSLSEHDEAAAASGAIAAGYTMMQPAAPLQPVTR